MIVLADNDLILKLAQCSLIDDLPDLLGSAEKIYVSPSARFQLLPKSNEKALRKAGSEAVLNSVRAFLERVEELPAIEDDALLVSMEGTDGIDCGEQQLLASMVELPNPYLITGDRRALSAVSNNKQRIPRIFNGLLDRVVTFESAILLGLLTFGFSSIRERLLGTPRPDGVLRLVATDSLCEGVLIECLTSYSREHYHFLAHKDRLANFYLRAEELGQD